MLCYVYVGLVASLFYCLLILCMCVSLCLMFSPGQDETRDRSQTARQQATSRKLVLYCYGCLFCCMALCCIVCCLIYMFAYVFKRPVGSCWEQAVRRRPGLAGPSGPVRLRRTLGGVHQAVQGLLASQ